MVLPLKRRKSRSPPGPQSPNSLPLPQPFAPRSERRPERLELDRSPDRPEQPLTRSVEHDPHAGRAVQQALQVKVYQLVVAAQPEQRRKSGYRGRIPRFELAESVEIGRSRGILISLPRERLERPQRLATPTQ